MYFFSKEIRPLETALSIFELDEVWQQMLQNQLEKALMFSERPEVKALCRDLLEVLSDVDECIQRISLTFEIPREMKMDDLIPFLLEKFNHDEIEILPGHDIAITLMVKGMKDTAESKVTRLFKDAMRKAQHKHTH